METTEMPLSKYLQVKAARLGIEVSTPFLAMAPWLTECYLSLVENNSDKDSAKFDIFAEAAIAQHDFLQGKTVDLPGWLNLSKHYQSLNLNVETEAAKFAPQVGQPPSKKAKVSASATSSGVSTRTCSHCKQEKSKKDFSNNQLHKKGPAAKCKSCAQQPIDSKSSASVDGQATSTKSSAGRRKKRKKS